MIPTIRRLVTWQKFISLQKVDKLTTDKSLDCLRHKCQAIINEAIIINENNDDDDDDDITGSS